MVNKFLMFLSWICFAASVSSVPVPSLCEIAPVGLGSYHGIQISQVFGFMPEKVDKTCVVSLSDLRKIENNVEGSSKYLAIKMLANILKSGVSKTLLVSCPQDLDMSFVVQITFNATKISQNKESDPFIDLRFYAIQEFVRKDVVAFIQSAISLNLGMSFAVKVSLSVAGIAGIGGLVALARRKPAEVLPSAAPRTRLQDLEHELFDDEGPDSSTIESALKDAIRAKKPGACVHTLSMEGHVRNSLFLDAFKEWMNLHEKPVVLIVSLENQFEDFLSGKSSQGVDNVYQVVLGYGGRLKILVVNGDPVGVRGLPNDDQGDARFAASNRRGVILAGGKFIAPPGCDSHIFFDGNQFYNHGAGSSIKQGDLADAAHFWSLELF